MANEIPPGNQTREIQEGLAGARDGLRTAIDRGADRARELKDAAMDRATHLREVATERAAMLRERGRDAWGSVERVIDERPLAVPGGVFVGGIILGMLLRRT